MFRTPVLRTNLTDVVASTYIDNICGSYYRGDVTFLATLRALLANRIDQRSHVFVNYIELRSASYNDTDSFGCFVRSLGFETGEFDSDNIFIINVNTGSDIDNDKVFDFVKSKYPKCWSKLDNVELFFMKSFRVCCMVNESIRTTLLFVDTIDLSKWHYLQCAIPVFLPWYFDPKDGLSEIEMELVNSLREKTSDKYEAIISKMSERCNFRERKIKCLLGNFGANVLQNRLHQINCEISEYESDISSLNDQIAVLIGKRSDCQVKRLGLQQKILDTSLDSELLDYFLSNQSAEIVKVQGSTMYFVSKGYITYYDEEQAKAVINNQSSYIYNPLGACQDNLICKDDIKRLMTAVFIDQKLKIKVCAEYAVDISKQRVIPITYSGVLLRPEYHEFIPNPHINRYGCMGSYLPIVNNLLLNCDYINIVEQCNASCQSLNFSDSVVMSDFVATICSNDDPRNHCIELPNGTVVNTHDAIEWLNNEVGV